MSKTGRRTPLPECCTHCDHCGRVYCRDVPYDISPCQHQRICADCYPRGCDICMEVTLPW